MKILPTQFGQSAEADFELKTWTFEIRAGAFAIVDKIVYDDMVKSISDMKQVIKDLQTELYWTRNR
jgi:hypothetical protein